MCKVLIVDDDNNYLESVSDNLQRMQPSYQIEPVYSFSQAVELILQGNLYDYAIIDVRLGDNTNDEDRLGLGLAATLNELQPDVRVIMLSQYNVTKVFMKALRATNIINFIEKGGKESFDELVRTIEENRSLPRIPKRSDMSSVEIALIDGQPLSLRARGHYVASGRSQATTLMDNLRKSSLVADEIGKRHGQWRGSAELIGQNLWRELFSIGNVPAEFYKSVISTSGITKLIFDGSTEFLRVPLEFTKPLTETDPFALLHPVTRFIQNITPATSPVFKNGTNMLTAAKNIRILVVAADTDPQLDGIEAEARELRSLLMSYRNKGYAIQYEVWLPNAVTFDRFRNVLMQEKYDIIHYIGHGLHRPRSPEDDALFFYEGENRTGEVKLFTARLLQSILTDYKVKMFYLSCCEGTATSAPDAAPNDDFLGIAHALVAAGVPTVLGYRWPVSDSGALLLATKFYEYFLFSGDPAIALWQARKRVAEQSRDERAWLSPILIHQD